MDTTQKPQEETFRIHNPEDARRHIRQEKSSEPQRKKRTAKPAQGSAAAKPRKKQPGRTAGKKTSAKAAPRKAAAAKAVPSGKRAAAKPDPDDISTKKRSYGKSKPKKKSAIALWSENLKKKQTTRKKSSREKQPTPAVIYTQPQAFNRHRPGNSASVSGTEPAGTHHYPDHP